MKADGTIDKYKARLVVKGFKQKEGLDYFDTYSPVSRITSIRMLIVLAAVYDLQIHQMDVKTAFLNGNLEEEIYMEQPEGFVVPGKENKVCKLVKSLYGLKQAPKQWHAKFEQTMLVNGFKINECDKYVYIKDTPNHQVIVCLYVDDMLIISRDISDINVTKRMLESKFDMKDLGVADVVLGIRIHRTPQGLVLSQSHYIKKVLDKFKYMEFGIAKTPLDVNFAVRKNEGESDSQLEELFSSEIIAIDYVKSKDNMSDPLTKGLSREGIERTSKGMGLRPRTSQHGEPNVTNRLCSPAAKSSPQPPPPAAGRHHHHQRRRPYHRKNFIGAPENKPVKMKGLLFKSKPKTPVELVRSTRDLVMYIQRSHSDVRESKREEKMMELGKTIRELKCVLYGNGQSEPVSDACSQLTQEFFREDTLRLLINVLPKLNLEARKDATQVVANLQRQQVQSRLIACDYLEANIDLMDLLVTGYENTDMALHYGTMLRECIRHQSVARYVLEPVHVKKFFDYIQLPNFDIAADAAATFKELLLFPTASLSQLGWNFFCQELLTRHKSTVAEFLSKNYDWFFAEYNSKLLESSNYITRRQAIKLLGDILLDRSNSAVMTRYVSSRDNLRILMNLLRESSKSIQIEAFHVFKLFAANKNKPSDIVNILVANRSKLLRLFADFKTEKEDEQFEADKAQVVKEIAALETKELS
ncbi:hypothetical protein FXO38_14340 [Capsicum annuum]|nr:hypothetical protein FXO38_14340 [Capsicum annuum]KAF3674837.1 hypothetical protein FXO37_06187 [Capsicum annuum]